MLVGEFESILDITHLFYQVFFPLASLFLPLPSRISVTHFASPEMPLDAPDCRAVVAVIGLLSLSLLLAGVLCEH